MSAYADLEIGLHHHEAEHYTLDMRFSQPESDADTRLLRSSPRLQFDVAAHRLKDEYGVECVFENISVATARWVECDDPAMLERFRAKCHDNLALDGAGELVYLAPTRVNLDLTQERWPDVRFLATREH